MFWSKILFCSIILRQKSEQDFLFLDMDGEFVGFTPLKMVILPKKIKVLV